MTERIYAPNRIKELRAARGWSQQRVAERLNDQTVAGTIAKLESRQMALSADYILGLAEVFGVSPGEIISKGGSGVREVPLLGAVAAGNWREAIAHASESVPIPDDLPGGSLFALRVEGDSMDLVVPNGGLIVVNPDDLDLVNNKVYVIANATHETTFKRFSLSPPRLLPVSSNTAHEPIVIGREPFVAIGRAIYALFPL